MSRKCELCGKGTQHGNKVSKSYNHTLRTWKPNLVSVKLQDELGSVATIKVCTQCLRTGFDQYGWTKKVRVNKDVLVADKK